MIQINDLCSYKIFILFNVFLQKIKQKYPHVVFISSFSFLDTWSNRKSLRVGQTNLIYYYGTFKNCQRQLCCIHVLHRNDGPDGRIYFLLF